MKKIVLVVLIAIISIGFAACGTQSSGTNSSVVTLKVGATSVPHAEILREIKSDLEKEGVHLEIVEYDDYVQPNIQLADGEIDANYFQHIPYFESFTKERGITNLTYIAKIHIEPMGIYSKKIKDLSELKNGARVSIPNDPSNMGRALALLENAGLIKLKDGTSIKGTIQDIVENKKNLKITPLNAPMLPRSLEDVDISVINTNFALQGNLNPTKDALVIEDSNSPYANILAVRKEDKDKESIKKLAKALTSEKVRKFIEDKYKGAIVPAF